MGIEEPASWDEKEVVLLPEDGLVLYTDGVNESQSPDGDLFDLIRLRKSIQAIIQLPAGEILEKILSDVMQFTCKEHCEDDIALMVLKRS